MSTTKIYVAKYIADPRRWEPQNIGVMLVSDSKAAHRFLGEQPDGKVYRTSVRETVNDTDIYVDWVRYFQRTLTPGDEGIQKILRETTGNYWVVETAEVLHGDADPEALVAEYFAKLVRPDPVQDEQGLEVAVESILEVAGVAESEYLSRNGEGDLVHLRNPRDRERLARIAVSALVQLGWRPPDGQGDAE